MPCIMSALSCAYAATSAVTAAMESENGDNIVAYSSGVCYNGSHCNPLFYLFLVIAYPSLI